MSPSQIEYLSIGGSRQTSASAWSSQCQVLAFGADQNVAIWQPLHADRNGISALLHGHSDKVTAVAFLHLADQIHLLSGAANGMLCIWTFDSSARSWSLVSEIQADVAALNVISTFNESKIFLTGSASATLSAWSFDGTKITNVTQHKTRPRFIPLALALGQFSSTATEKALFVTAAGTSNDIYLYCLKDLQTNPKFELQATLKGHEGWIRSLAIRKDVNEELLLASASADKYVRLWRFSSGESVSRKARGGVEQISSFEQTLVAKSKVIQYEGAKYTVTFEALLLGHDDWVYSADWQSSGGNKLLTASADGTLAIWEPDPTSGIWVSESRLGEISGQKGATTATGSAGGFWKGLWIEGLYGSGKPISSVLSLGRTGSWRVWSYDSTSRFWIQTLGNSGHISSANSIAWAKSGAYLLSTSSDQTTRLHAEWRRNGKRTWHEFARPQIHGYDLNCLSSSGLHQFVSGADEKLLRVFNEPKELAQALHRLCNIDKPDDSNALPETAAIPVLGLSNKALGEPDDIIEAGPRRGDDEYAAAASRFGEMTVADLKEPPTEDLLARHTLWPEHEKLYGHGYEISESAFNDHNKLLATACKASSLDHATIRFYDAENDWREIKPPLTAHALTVTRLAWSTHPQPYLLSVGRDRQWAIFKPVADSGKKYELLQTNPKAHTRMILDAAWSSIEGSRFFATAGRDKCVKIWTMRLLQSHDVNKQGLDGSREDDKTQKSSPFELLHTLTRPTAVTAIDFTCDDSESNAVLAVGEEHGSISVHWYAVGSSLELTRSIELEKTACPSKAVTRLAWRPNAKRYAGDGKGAQLAVAAADGSVRILRIDVES